MYGLDYTINRFFSVYGPRMDCEGAYTEVIFNWLNQIHKGNNEITVFGNPDEKILDLVYVEDVVNAIILTTFNSNKDVFTYGLKGGVTYPIAENTSLYSEAMYQNFASYKVAEAGYETVNYDSTGFFAVTAGLKFNF